MVFSDIEGRARQGVKTKEYRDISCFYNTAERDASVFEKSKLFFSEPLGKWYLLFAPIPKPDKNTSRNRGISIFSRPEAIIER